MSHAVTSSSSGKPPLAVRLRSRLLALSPDETSFAKIGFPAGEPVAQATLEGHGASFVGGANAALAAATVEDLREPLEAFAPAQRGFAYEGSGTALAALDLLVPGRRDRLATLLRTHGAPYAYVVHIGAGLALARLRLRPRNRLRALDPFARWLMLDGYGFHEGLQHHRRFLERHARTRRLAGYELRAFDQGLGRCVWFYGCADPERVGAIVGGFPAARHADVWSGVGLAAAYTTAGGAEELARLRALAGAFAADVAVGAALAAYMRHQQNDVVERTRTASEQLCELPLEDLVAGAERVLAELGGARTTESHGVWRARLRDWLEARLRDRAA